ncbi:alpha/beta hydrolase fold domain-containing protein [Butyrivibrio sp. AE2015]|uniref:alpha/beta hydrolase fold domain-containing protein n=1 Tax=Butyrivibrio sp. AE2015 TaxID=1280663 RepID=UPI000409AD3E|nr:alpha/beta hydrolase fold domain-containing protein [Butyrivibrio sp. AE2015]
MRTSRNKIEIIDVKELGINPDQIMVGGESAGGGLTAAISMLAREWVQIKKVNGF